MSAPQDLPQQMAAKTDRELVAMFESPGDWATEALTAARAELQKRNIDTTRIEDAPIRCPRMQTSSTDISQGRRYKLLCIPWLVTIAVTFPGILAGPQFLPAGLYRLLGVPDWWLGVGWLAYLALSVAACMSRRRLTYFIVYTVLCVLLALNCVGCRAFWSEFDR